jgi:hypothetical protein
MNSTRLGGALLAVGALGYVVAVVVYIVQYGQPTGTDPNGVITLADRVAHYRGRQSIARMLWFVELAAALLISIAGFILQHREVASRSVMAGRAAWTAVGVGAVILSLMYAVMLGGYPSAAARFDDEPGLFAALNGIATLLFNVGNGVVFLGLAGAFAAERGSAGVVSRSLGTAGILLGLLSALTAFGMLMGIGSLSAAAPLGLIAFLLTTYLGFAIWRV